MPATNVSLCEVPLCTLAFIDFTSISSSLEFSQSIADTRVYNLALSSLLALEQEEVDEVGWAISNEIALAHQLDCQMIYDQSIESALALVSGEEEIGVFNASPEHSLQFSQEVGYQGVMYISICDYIPLVQRLANVIEINIESVIDFNLEEIDGIEHTIELVQEILTNMDDLNCLSPYGFSGDKSLESILTLSQSISVQMVYSAAVSQSLALLNTVAWR